jgi:tripartite-type tricarboxylate transporter receptor subunit TctC
MVFFESIEIGPYLRALITSMAVRRNLLLSVLRAAKFLHDQDPERKSAVDERIHPCMLNPVVCQDTGEQLMAIKEMPIRHPAVAISIVLIVATALGWASSAAADNYPSRLVKIVVPFPGGGPLDFTARAVADHLQASLKQPFVVENRPGATGNIGAEHVARAAPDGHTLLFVLDTVLTANPALYKRLTFDPERDFRPISVVATFYQMLVVHPSLPVNSLAEFVAFAKKQGVTYGSGGGNGNPGHLTMEYFRRQAGFEAMNVPYRGAALATTDLLAGQFQVGFLTIPAVVQHVKSGKLRALAISSPQRIPSAPDIPTVSETYPGFEAGFDLVLLAPAATPEAIRNLLEHEVQNALKSSALQARLRVQELEPVGSTASEASPRLRRTTERWLKVIREGNITPN